MERNKKNTVIDAAEPAVRMSRPVGGDVKTVVTDIATEFSEQKIPAEINGPKGPEPTRYGDWEQKGRCTDF
jgi:hypothetical protein